MSYRVLIVEDMPELLQAMKNFYREKGAGLFEVETASDGKDALAKLNVKKENDMFICMVDMCLH
ncbi:MAG: response regulator [Saccharofermentans sp.]|nr:response regulator [Saccharofermentans sp.]